MTPRFLALPLLLALSTAGAGCNAPADAAAPSAPAKEGSGEVPAAQVETVRLDRASFEELLELPGETLPLRTALITPEAAGRIVSLPIADHQVVRAGDVVMRLDTARLQKDIESIRIRLDQLERDIERTSRLIEKGLAVETQLEALTTERDAARKSLEQLDVLGRQATTRAPIGGVIVGKSAETGEFASPGVPVARIVDVSTIKVVVGVPERDVPFVREGQEVSVRIDATGEVIVGTIAHIAVQGDTRNRTFPVEVHIGNPDGRLRAGMRVTTVLSRRRLDNVLVVPRDALVQAAGGEEAFVVRNGLAASVPVRLGPALSRFVVVESGLSDGDELVVRGHRALVQGEHIRVTGTEACCSTQVDAFLRDRRSGSATPSPTAGADRDAGN